MAEPLGRVDRYALLTKIGQGSFGAVYRAKHVHTGQLVALKLACADVDPEAAARILAEGRAAASLRHPNVVGVLDSGISDKGEAFVVMELLEGNTLAELVAREGPLPVGRAVAIATQMLDALAAAHAAGVVHRDVKPSNVFVAPGDAVKVIDFGISKLRRTSATGPVVLTIPGIAMGTPGYMAPEQLGDASSVDARADLYSVGATLYEMLSKKLPFDARAFEEWMRKLASESAAPLGSVAPSVPRAVAEVVDRALARDPDARFSTAAAMRAALVSASRPAPPKAEARRTTRPPPPAKARRASVLPWVFAIAGVALAFASVAAVALTVAWTRAEQRDAGQRALPTAASSAPEGRGSR